MGSGGREMKWAGAEGGPAGNVSSAAVVYSAVAISIILPENTAPSF